MINNIKKYSHSKLIVIIILFSMFFVLAKAIQSQGNEKNVNLTGWSVFTYIWNERTNLLARTNCNLVNQKLINLDRTPANELNEDSSCGLSGDRGGKVLYWHGVDNFKEDNDSPNNPIFGKLTGRAYSPIFGPILFRESEFPDETCYGISGDNRQPRLERVEEKIHLLGCAYVPNLRNWILFSRKGNDGLFSNTAGLPTSANWAGTTAIVKTDTNLGSSISGIITPPYLFLKGCGWSSSEGFWVLGTDVKAATSSCISHTSRLAKLGAQVKNSLNNSGIVGSVVGIGSQTARVTPSHSNARFGQRVSYTILCSKGFSSASYSIKDNKEITTVDRIIGFLLREPIENFTLSCRDNRNFFSGGDRIIASGINILSLSFTNTEISPQLLTEGGFVYIKGKLLSFVEDAKCKIINSIDTNSRSISSIERGVIKSISEPFFVSRDVEFSIQCSFGNPSSRTSSSTIKTFLVKVLPNKLSERVVRKNGIIRSETIASEEANQRVLNFIIPKDIVSLRVYKVNATDEISSENRYISEDNVEILLKKDQCSSTETSSGCYKTISCGSTDSALCDSSENLKAAFYEKIQVPALKEDKIIKVLVVEGVYSDGSLTKRSCFGFLRDNQTVEIRNVC